MTDEIPKAFQLRHRRCRIGARFHQRRAMMHLSNQSSRQYDHHGFALRLRVFFDIGAQRL